MRTAGQDLPAFRARSLCQLEHQARLTHAGLAGDEHEAAPTFARRPKPLRQQTEFVLPSDERCAARVPQHQVCRDATLWG